MKRLMTTLAILFTLIMPITAIHAQEVASTPEQSLVGLIDRLDPNVFLIVLLIAGGVFAVISHLSTQKWVEALRDSVPTWALDPIADALSGGSDALIDMLQQRAEQTPSTFDDVQVAELKRRLEELEAVVRGNQESKDVLPIE